MIPSNSDDRLVQALGADLKPVRRLARPGVRVLIWLAIVGAAAVALTMVTDLQAVVNRLTVAPEMWLAAIGSTFTAVLAAVAAFQLSLPDRKVTWALLPLPAALLWLGANGTGCLAEWSTAKPDAIPPLHCLMFIIAVSAPLSLLLILMLRRGFSMRPNLTAIVGGLACASAAAALLNLIHPYETALTDLAAHALAVVTVIVANTVLGGRILTSQDAFTLK
jgi:hypothetical protein